MGDKEQQEFGDFSQYLSSVTYNLSGPIPICVGHAESYCSLFVKNVPAEGFLVPYKLMTHSFGSLRASIVLIQAGATAQVPAVLRHCLEAAGYALLFEKKPEWRKIWEDRHSSDSAKQKFRKRSQSEVREVLAAEGDHLGKAYAHLYDLLVDFGAHPNVLGIESVVDYHKLDGDLYQVDLQLLTDQDEKNSAHYVLVLCAMLFLQIMSAIWRDAANSLKVKQKCNSLRIELDEFGERYLSDH